MLAAGQGSMHVDLSIFAGNHYGPAWLLLLPAFNYVKNLVLSWRQGGGERECACDRATCWAPTSNFVFKLQIKKLRPSGHPPCLLWTA